MCACVCLCRGGHKTGVNSAYCPIQSYFPYSVLVRLVNENEVKQWKDQAESFRRGKSVPAHNNHQKKRQKKNSLTYMSQLKFLIMTNHTLSTKPNIFIVFLLLKVSLERKIIITLSKYSIFIFIVTFQKYYSYCPDTLRKQKLSNLEVGASVANH